MGSNAVNIRSAKKEDQQEILDLLNTVFAENQRSSIRRGNDYWEWKFKPNVFGNSIINVAEVNDEIVGIDHFWPWQLTYRGETINAYQPCDAAVSSTYIGQGIFKSLRLRGLEQAEKSNGQLLFNFPNSNSLHLNTRLGAKHLGKIVWRVKVLEPLNMFKGMLKDELSIPANIDNNFSLDFNKLYRLSSDYKNDGCFISINRKVGFFEWRYLNRPDREYGMVSFEQRQEMIGAIFTMNQKGTKREMVLVDILGAPNLSGNLFNKIVEVARFMGVTYMVLMDNPQFKTHKLWRKGFVKK